jgi:hypothetical protein
MARTLQQLDIAVAALESTVPTISVGLMTTLRQTALSLESEYMDIAMAIGSPTDVNGNPNATGIYATVSSLQASIASIQSALAVLDTSLSALQAQVTALQN